LAGGWEISMKKFISAIVLGLGILLVPHAKVSADAESITILDNSFSPATYNITAGSAVTWMNAGAMGHTVTSDTALFDSNNIAPGGSYTYTFTTAGVYPYYCKYHGAAGGTGMAGSVVVTAMAVDPVAPIVTGNGLQMPGSSASSANGLQVPTGLQYQDPGPDLPGAPINTVVGDNGLVAIAQYPSGPRLIQLSGDPVIYWVSPLNIKIPVWNDAVMASYHLNKTDVQVADQNEFDYYLNAQYIRLNGKGVIYKIEGSTKRSIPSSVWNVAGIDPSIIIDVNKTDLNSYKTGKAVKSGELDSTSPMPLM
jgi:plastocyanin